MGGWEKLITEQAVHSLRPHHHTSPHPSSPTETASLASVRAWRTLSTVSTAELVVAPSGEELSSLVIVGEVTQPPACLLLD